MQNALFKTLPGDTFLPEEDELVLAMANSTRRPDWGKLAIDMKAMGYNRTLNSLQLRKRLIFNPESKAVNRLVKSALRNVIRFQSGKVRAAQHAKDHPEMARARAKRSRDTHKDEMEYKDRRREKEKRNLPAKRAYESERYKTNPQFNTIKKCRMRLTHLMAVTNGHKQSTTLDLVGCTTKQLTEHLQIQRPGLELIQRHIDHIFPFAKYDMEVEQHKVMNFTNMQPLTGPENLSKHDKLPTKAMAAKVDPSCWPDGVTINDLPTIYPGWATPLRMTLEPEPAASASTVEEAADEAPESEASMPRNEGEQPDSDSDDPDDSDWLRDSDDDA